MWAWIDKSIIAIFNKKLKLPHGFTTIWQTQ